MSHVHDLTAGHGPPAGSVGFALEVLRCRFPRVCLWIGTSTKCWWAYVGGHLIEARTPQELARRLDLDHAITGAAATGTAEHLAEIADSRPETRPCRSHRLASQERRGL